jgi:hypothetical protein
MQQVWGNDNRDKFLDVKPKGGQKNHLGEVNLWVKLTLVTIRMDTVIIKHGWVKWIQVATDRIQQQDFVLNLAVSLFEKQLI